LEILSFLDQKLDPALVFSFLNFFPSKPSLKKSRAALFFSGIVLLPKGGGGCPLIFLQKSSSFPSQLLMWQFSDYILDRLVVIFAVLCRGFRDFFSDFQMSWVFFSFAHRFAFQTV